MKIVIVLSTLLLAVSTLFAETCYYSFGKKVLLKPLPQSRSVADHTIRYYQTPSGAKVGVTDEIIIGCKDIEACKPILEAYPVASVEKLSDRLYLLKLKPGSNLFKTANALYHEAPIFLSHPNFIKKRISR